MEVLEFFKNNNSKRKKKTSVVGDSDSSEITHIIDLNC